MFFNPHGCKSLFVSFLTLAALSLLITVCVTVFHFRVLTLNYFTKISIPDIREFFRLNLILLPLYKMCYYWSFPAKTISTHICTYRQRC